MDSVSKKKIEIRPATRENPEHLAGYFSRVRQDSENLCRPLEIEDYGVQTMPDVSPPKWHIAHTSWFFETLLLKPFLNGFKPLKPIYAHLFNSYYDTLGSYHPRPERGHLSRPTVAEVYDYCRFIDEKMQILIAQTNHPQRDEIVNRTVLGLNHEQQHQELVLTDIKHIFATNPLRPSYRHLENPEGQKTELNWIRYQGGIFDMGHMGNSFCYDNETPLHPVLLQDYQLATRPVSNAEYIEFIDDGGYHTPHFWLSEAWNTIQEKRWKAPLYWDQDGSDWVNMTLGGMRDINPHAPVSHLSFYEADAYAKWAGKRLPTEQEWEHAAADLLVDGNLRESDLLQPAPLLLQDRKSPGGLRQMYGDVWEWTRSPYVPYPGYKAEEGPLGEYNGKFMSSQMVLKGGSCVTPRDHIRKEYRNFFYPADRWQFSGLRLADDA